MHKWAKLQYRQIIPVSWRVLLAHPHCDAQSTCVTSSLELIKIIRKDYPRNQDREDAILQLLNHEKLLDRPLMYNNLALLTIHETVQTVMHYEEQDNAGLLEKLQELELKLSNYPYREAPRDAQDVQLFYLKHIGDGIGYLKMKKEMQQPKQSAVSWPSIDW